MSPRRNANNALEESVSDEHRAHSGRGARNEENVRVGAVRFAPAMSRVAREGVAERNERGRISNKVIAWNCERSKW